MDAPHESEFIHTSLTRTLLEPNTNDIAHCSAIVQSRGVQLSDRKQLVCRLPSPTAATLTLSLERISRGEPRLRVLSRAEAAEARSACVRPPNASPARTHPTARSVCPPDRRAMSTRLPFVVGGGASCQRDFACGRRCHWHRPVEFNNLLAEWLV